MFLGRKKQGCMQFSSISAFIKERQGNFKSIVNALEDKKYNRISITSVTFLTIWKYRIITFIWFLRWCDRFLKVLEKKESKTRKREKQEREENKKERKTRKIGKQEREKKKKERKTRKRVKGSLMLFDTSFTKDHEKQISDQSPAPCDPPLTTLKKDKIIQKKSAHF